MIISFTNTSIVGALGLLLACGGCAKAPEACFVADKGSLNTKVNEEIQFNAACSTDADTYTWEYGDGSGDTGAAVKHKYPRAGSYEVKLMAKNSSKTSTSSKTVVVTQ